MAQELRNDGEGTNGATLAATNAGAPSAFNTTTRSGIGTTTTYDNVRASSGSTSIKRHLAAVASTCYESWTSTTLTSTANAYLRYFIYLTAYPTVTLRLHGFISTAASNGTLEITTTGTIRTVNSAGSVIATTVGVVPLNQWVRIESEQTGISGTTGTVAARFFSGANLSGTTPDANGSLSNAAQTVVGNVTELRLGVTSSATPTLAWDIWYDDVAWSDTKQPGPIAAGFRYLRGPNFRR